MGKLPWAAMVVGAAGVGMAAFMALMNRDRKAYLELIKDKEITDPREVWDICCEYHKETKMELAQAKARIEAGEEICRVGQGLLEVRKMMWGPEPPQELKTKKLLGQEITKEELEAADAERKKKVTPIEVKQAIIAHWWTELMQLFVPWGIIVPEEIDTLKKPCFRLASEEVTEAVLRGEVYRYKTESENLKKRFDKLHEKNIREIKRHAQERVNWKEEHRKLLREIAELKGEPPPKDEPDFRSWLESGHDIWLNEED